MSSEMSTRRTYELRQRAERQKETRQRIVAAAVELHTTRGPSRTSVQAIADRAGVTRPTVYAHFPDERSLFAACSGHVRDATPPPDQRTWRAIADPVDRLEAALRELYAYYESLEPLLEKVQRDAPVMPVIAEIDESRVRYLAEAQNLLAQEWAARGREKTHLRQAIGLALQFGTWQSLFRTQGCTTKEAVELMVALARAAAER
jgi:AcrR family transcriptional regulator